VHPILIKIGPFTIFTFGFFLCLAFLLSIWVVGQEGQRLGLPKNRLYDLCFYILIAALIGSRLAHVFLEWPHFQAHPLDIFKLWEGGLAFQGGLMLGMMVAVIYIWHHHLPVLTTLDILAVGTPLGQSMGRIGCFMAGCCYGKPSDLPWAVTFTDPGTLGPLGVSIHPTELYESILYLGVFIVIFKMRIRKKFAGQLFGLYLLLAGLARFIVEFFRGDDRGPDILWGMPVTQAVALSLVVLGGVFLIIGSFRKIQAT
jgi:phosphatidylglycerol:prolipoprotein diacylglycerol transferase